MLVDRFLRLRPVRVASIAAACLAALFTASSSGGAPGNERVGGDFDRRIERNAEAMLDQGRTTFRFDTFGDEAFWGGALKLHLAIEGARLGGVGPGITPRAALDLGLKV